MGVSTIEQRVRSRQAAAGIAASGVPVAVRLFFFLSGASALACEIAWLRKLGLVFGNTTHAIAAVLAVFMAGLGLGSFVVGRYSGRWKNPLRAYGVLEIVVGVYAALSSGLFGVLESAYVAVAQSTGAEGPALVAARLAGAFILLFPPTFCMGATLPVLAGHCVRRSDGVGRDIGLLYGLNTLGAVAGTVGAGYFLVPVLGTFGTLMAAAAANLAIGAAAIAMAPRSGSGESPAPPEPAASAADAAAPPVPVWLLPAGLALSGFIALAYEVAWTRALAVVIGSSTFAFTIMLATFLLGLAGGSLLAERVLRRRAARAADWGWLQVGVALGALATLPLFEKTDLLLMRFVASSLEAPLLHDAFRFLCCSMLMIVPTLCMGALFPVSVALHSRGASSVGRDVGLLYLCNTGGNLAGSLAAGFLLIPAIGIHRTLLLVAVVGGVAGLAILFMAGGGTARRAALGCAAAAALVAAVVLQRDGWNRVRMTSLLHYDAAALGEYSSEDLLGDCFTSDVVFYREGACSVVSVDCREGAYTLRSNGKPDASTRMQDLRTQSLLGHLPMMVHPDARRALVIGFGSGATVNAVLKHGVEAVDCVEIEPAVIEAAPWFASINGNCVDDPRVRIVVNDGRNHMLVEDGQYDVIVSEPSNPWIAGIATLFTTEFYQLAERRLAPGGVLCQWVQSYKMAPEDVRMIVATVQQVFPEVQVWSPNTFDLVLIAAREPVAFDIAAVDRSIDANADLRADLSAVGIRGAGGMLAFHLLRSGDVAAYAKDARINSDNRLPLEFSAPRHHYQSTVGAVFEGLLAHRSANTPATVPASVDEVPGAVTDMGHACLLAERFADAEALFRRALDIDPSDAEAMVGLARCHIKREEYAEGADLIERAVRRAPQSAVVQEGWGIVNLGTGDPEAALAAFEAALAVEPWRWELRGLAATALEAAGRFDEAAQAHLDAGEPIPVASRVSAARCLTMAGRHAEALELLQQVLADYPLDFRVHAQLTESARAAGDLAPALASYRALMEANPYSRFVREKLAEIEKDAAASPAS